MVASTFDSYKHLAVTDTRFQVLPGHSFQITYD